MDRGASKANVHGVAKSQTGLSDIHFLTVFLPLSQTHIHEWMLLLLHFTDEETRSRGTGSQHTGSCTGVERPRWDLSPMSLAPGPVPNVNPSHHLHAQHRLRAG